MASGSRGELFALSRLLKEKIVLEKSRGKEVVLRTPAKKEKAGKTEGVLAALAREVASCRKCRLCEGRTQTVFGEGNPKAPLMFIGEAPGRDEDLQGRPFVGQAGKLLTKIIEAMGLKREEVYIANVLKCRPPQNRPPLPDEVDDCRGYLERQIDLIRPKVLCALGRHAATVLVGPEENLTSLRGRFFDFRGTPVLVTFHPAYLLRNPSAKRLVWEDMKKVKAYLEADH